MRAFWTILSQEIVSSKMILLTAFVASWLPILAPLMPGNERHSPVELQLAVLAVVVPGLGGLLLLGIGSSFLGRDLSEQRLSFYFARPIPGWTLWIAKLLGSYLVVLASLCLILLPALVLSPELRPEPRQIEKIPFFWLNVLLAPLVLLALIHAISIILRARTAWLLLDLVAIAGCVFLGWQVYDVLRSNEVQVSMSESSITLLGIALLTNLFVAGGLQTVLGRTDIARSHRVLSTTLWGPILLFGLVLVGGAVWLTSPDEAEIDGLRFAQTTPGGHWILVGGKLPNRPGYRGMFLLHTDTGRSVHVGSLADARASRFSSDGSTMITPRCQRIWQEPCSLYRYDLNADEPTPEALGPEITTPLTPFNVSPSGQRLAIYSDGQLAIHDLSENRLLDARRLEPVSRLRFETENRVRFYQQPRDWKIVQMALDLENNRLDSLGEVPENRVTNFLRTPPGTGVELLPPAAVEDSVQKFSPELRFLDPFEHLWSFMEMNIRSKRLIDDRLVLGDVQGIEVFSAAGEKEHHFPLPEVQGITTHLLVSGEVQPGQVAIGLHQNQSDMNPPMRIHMFWETYLLNIETGEWTLMQKDRRPLPNGWPSGELEPLFFVDKSKLVVLEPEATETRTVLEFRQRW